MSSTVLTNSEANGGLCWRVCHYTQLCACATASSLPQPGVPLGELPPKTAKASVLARREATYVVTCTQYTAYSWKDYYGENGLLGDSAVDARAEAALRQMKGVHDDWMTDEVTDGDNVEAGPSIVKFCRFEGEKKGKRRARCWLAALTTSETVDRGRLLRQVIGHMLGLKRRVPRRRCVRNRTECGCHNFRESGDEIADAC